MSFIEAFVVWKVKGRQFERGLKGILHSRFSFHFQVCPKACLLTWENTSWARAVTLFTGSFLSEELEAALETSHLVIFSTKRRIRCCQEKEEKDGRKTRDIARTPQVLGPDVWDSPITCKLELPCLTDCLIDTVFFAPHLMLWTQHANVPHLL